VSDLFKDILPSVQLTKKHVLETEKDYVPFVINRMLSYHDDSIFYANEMNRFRQLPERLQYDYFFFGLRSKRRPFAPWIKPKKMEDLAVVKQYFNYGDAKALEALNVLTEEQLVIIRKAMTPG
jgi:hypothetical protein